MTTSQIFDGLSAKGVIPSEGTTKIYLAALVKRKTLVNVPKGQADDLGHGYGLPNWK